MSSEFYTPTFEAVVAEQAVVQQEKHQGRLLEDYSVCIFPGQHWEMPVSSVVADFVRPISVDESSITLNGVIAGICRANEGRTVSWVDMGGGRGLAMRQIALTAKNQNLATTVVDLFDYGLNDLKPAEIERLERHCPGITTLSTAPNIILADVETVALPEKADIITSVEVIQYLNNPLASLANWYNQLADFGIMMIATPHKWTQWIHYVDHYSLPEDNTPPRHLLNELTKAGIPYAATGQLDYENGFRPDLRPDHVRSLIIQKQPDTKMQVNSSVAEIKIVPKNYKRTLYHEPKDAPIVEVLA